MEKFLLSKKDKFKIYGSLYLHLCIFCAITIGLTILINQVDVFSSYFCDIGKDGKTVPSNSGILLSMFVTLLLVLTYRFWGRHMKLPVLKNIVPLFPILVCLELQPIFYVLGIETCLLYFVTAFLGISFFLASTIFLSLNPFKYKRKIMLWFAIFLLLAAISNFVSIDGTLKIILIFLTSLLFAFSTIVEGQIFRCKMEEELDQETLEREFFDLLLNLFINIWGMYFLYDLFSKLFLKIFIQRR